MQVVFLSLPGRMLSPLAGLAVAPDWGSFTACQGRAWLGSRRPGRGWASSGEVSAGHSEGIGSLSLACLLPLRNVCVQACKPFIIWPFVHGYALILVLIIYWEVWGREVCLDDSCRKALTFERHTLLWLFQVCLTVERECVCVCYSLLLIDGICCIGRHGELTSASQRFRSFLFKVFN